MKFFKFHQGKQLHTNSNITQSLRQQKPQDFILEFLIDNKELQTPENWNKKFLCVNMI